MTTLTCPFQLQEQQVVSIASEDLQISFARVLEDSRCPANAMCLDPGRARIEVGVVVAGHHSQVRELVLAEQSANAAQVQVAGYLVRLLALDPYPGTPAAAVQGENPRYTATMVVSKA